MINSSLESFLRPQVKGNLHLLKFVQESILYCEISYLCRKSMKMNKPLTNKKMRQLTNQRMRQSQNTNKILHHLNQKLIFHNLSSILNANQHRHPLSNNKISKIFTQSRFCLTKNDRPIAPCLSVCQQKSKRK